MANTFDEMCERYEGYGMVQCHNFAYIASERLSAAFTDIFGDGYVGREQTVLLVLYAVAVDGKITRDEFKLVKPLLTDLLGKRISFGKAEAIIQDTVGEKSRDDIVEEILKLKAALIKYKEDLNNDFGMMMMCTCAIDGSINAEEREFLLRIIFRGRAIRCPSMIMVIGNDHSARPSIIRRQLNNAIITVASVDCPGI